MIDMLQPKQSNTVLLTDRDAPCRSCSDRILQRARAYSTLVLVSSYLRVFLKVVNQSLDVAF